MHADSWIVSWLSTFVSSTSPVLPLVHFLSCRLPFCQQKLHTSRGTREECPVLRRQVQIHAPAGQTLRPFHEDTGAAFLFCGFGGRTGAWCGLADPASTSMIRLMPQHQGKPNAITIPTHPRRDYVYEHDCERVNSFTNWRQFRKICLGGKDAELVLPRCVSV